ARLTNCGPTSSRRFVWSRVSTASISMPLTLTMAAATWSVTKSSRVISRAGSTGPRRTAWVWISIPRISPTPRPPTVSHWLTADKGIRNLRIEHGIACRKIGAEIGKQLGTPAVTNVWIPDGYKDIPVDRTAPRERLTEALDRIFAEPIDPKIHLDAVE